MEYLVVEQNCLIFLSSAVHHRFKCLMILMTRKTSDQGAMAQSLLHSEVAFVHHGPGNWGCNPDDSKA